MDTLLFLNISSPDIILILIALSLPIYCILDIMRSSFGNQTNKLLWIIIVFLAPANRIIALFGLGTKSKSIGGSLDLKLKMGFLV